MPKAKSAESFPFRRLPLSRAISYVCHITISTDEKRNLYLFSFIVGIIIALYRGDVNHRRTADRYAPPDAA